MHKQRIGQLINDMKSLNYCCRRIISLNEELEVINHKRLGLSREVPELTTEQEKSILPFPSYQPNAHSPLALMELASDKEREIRYYQHRIMDCQLTESLDIRDQNILWDLYIFRMRQEDVADKYGYSRSGLWKHIKQVLY